MLNKKESERTWTILELERASILRVKRANESKGEVNSLVAEVAFTDEFISKLAWNLTQSCAVRKSIDNFRDIVIETVKQMLSVEGDISKHLSLIFRILEASNITQQSLERRLMEAGYLGAK